SWVDFMVGTGASKSGGTRSLPILMDKLSTILVIQLKRAGDVIVTTPVLPVLRAALPEAKIDFLVDRPFAPLLENNPYLRDIHRYDRSAPWKTWKTLRAAKYDLIL